MIAAHTPTVAGPGTRGNVDPRDEKETPMPRYVARFDELSRTDVSLAGGKGANLGAMTRAGLPVPPGFVVTAEAFHAASMP